MNIENYAQREKNCTIRVIRKVSWREGFEPGFEKIVWHALKVEKVYVAIKKHMHKSFDGLEMLAKKFLLCCERAPGTWYIWY